MSGNQLLAEFLLETPHHIDALDFDNVNPENGWPWFPLHIAHAFADWMVQTGRITQEQGEREKRILNACHNGS